MFTIRDNVFISTYILNIGLDKVPVDGASFTNGVRNPPVVERMFAAVQAARRAGFEIANARLLQSDSEPTVVAVVRIDESRMEAAAMQVAEALNQDCIAVLKQTTEQGWLIGPRAAAWGKFNPAFFLLPTGARLSDTQQARKNETKAVLQRQLEEARAEMQRPVDFTNEFCDDYSAWARERNRRANAEARIAQIESALKEL